jgi:hypothetical protein
VIQQEAQSKGIKRHRPREAIRNGQQAIVATAQDEDLMAISKLSLVQTN